MIGGTGFIGSHLVRRIASLGHTVAIYHRGQTRADIPADVLEILNPLSLTPIDKFPRQLFEFEPEIIVHTMAMGAADAEAAVTAFAGLARRLVLLSSGDVYLAYGRFTGIEPGPIIEGLLSEDSPLRTKLFPYRKRASSSESLEHWYEKILAEEVVLSNGSLPGTVLRLPKVYGPGGNADLATVYKYRHQPNWRWTHGYVENVAAAIALAATSPSASDRVYNVGEAHTPTIAERLESMPPSVIGPDHNTEFNFSQNIAYDTSRLRNELGFREVISEQEAMLKTLGCHRHL